MSSDFFFYFLDVDSDTDNIRIFGFTKEHRRLILNDKHFHPYFYVVPNTDIQVLADQIKTANFADDKGNPIKVLEAQFVNRKINDKLVKLIKIVVNKTDEIPMLRREIAKLPGVNSCEEYDIRFYRRYLVDKGIVPLSLCKARGELVKQESDVDTVDVEYLEIIDTEPTSDLKVLAIDIETLCEKAAPDPKHDTIIFISLYGKDFQKTLTWKRFEDAHENVQILPGELELLEEFKKIILLQKPDVIVGYGSDNFDFPFLAERAAKYGLSLNLGFDGSAIDINRRAITAAKIKGIQHIDISHFVRNILDLNVDRFKLDIVAQELLGKGKLFKLNAQKISEIWQIGLSEELRSLADYNLVDAQLAYELFVKLLPTQMQLVKLIGLPLADINRMSYGQLVEWFLIRNSKPAGLVVPRKPSSSEVYARQLSTYYGAFVLEPTPGFYRDVAVLDFRSLYPSIIASHNISPEKINCECCKLHGGHGVGDEILFCSKTQGFIPGLIKDVIDRRNRINAILEQTNPSDPAFQELKARQYALKTIANSTYGYLGFPGSRWYSLESAKAITALGRKYIQLVIKEAEKFGFKSLYGDTDSLFILAGDKSTDDIKKFIGIINSVLPKPMELEYRDFYPAALFLEAKSGGRGAKKRYALLTKNKGLILKGVEAIRGDWSPLAKKAQKTAIELMLTEGGPEGAAKYIQELISKVKSQKVPVEDLFISVRLTKAISAYAARTPHVAAAEIAEKKGHHVRAGFTVSYVITKGTGKFSERLKLAEDATLEDYDPDYYVDNQILRAVYKLFEIFNYPTEKLKGGQTTLGEGWN
jgi:DNA polymerase elongation subunit (family B)